MNSNIPNDFIIPRNLFSPYVDHSWPVILDMDNTKLWNLLKGPQIDNFNKVVAPMGTLIL